MKKLVAKRYVVCDELKYHNSIDANASRFPPKIKSKPSAAGSIWKGGARERADDIFFAIGIKRRRSKADFAPTWNIPTL